MRLLLLGAAAIVGYVAARALLDHEVPADIPAPLRGHLQMHQAQLRRAREQARSILAVARAATAEAERELTADYRRRSHRSL